MRVLAALPLHCRCLWVRGMVLTSAVDRGAGVTKNRRFEAYYDRLNDQRIAASSGSPTTLPPSAWGPEPIVWAKPGERASVWAWISWPDRVAERTPARAKGWNDRVVIVEWDAEGGSRDTVVWRNAVTRRSPAATHD